MVIWLLQQQPKYSFTIRQIGQVHLLLMSKSLSVSSSKEQNTWCWLIMAKIWIFTTMKVDLYLLQSHKGWESNSWTRIPFLSAQIWLESLIQQTQRLFEFSTFFQETQTTSTLKIQMKLLQCNSTKLKSQMRENYVSLILIETCSLLWSINLKL